MATTNGTANGTSAESSDKPPAYFRSLTVSNYRCFGPEPQTLNLCDTEGKPAHWTILLGENGTGKTSLLALMAMLAPYLAHDQAGLYYTSGFSDFPAASKLHFFEGVTGVSATLYVSDLLGRLTALNGSSFKFQIEGILSNSMSSVSMTAYDMFPLDPNPLSGYGASRRMSRKALSESRNEDSCLTIFDDSAELLNAEEWLVQTDYATKTGTEVQKKRAQERYERIKAIFVGDGPGTGLLPDVTDFRFTVTDDNAMTPRVEAQTPYGWVRVRDLSLGYQAALTWIVDFASRLLERYPNSPNPLAEPAICLVDEIDLHLHPRWQRELLRVLSDTFPQTQFIVTAHSPLIVQAAPNANLALLRREGDHVVIENDVDYIRNWRVDQILASDLFGEVPVHHPDVERQLARQAELSQKRRLSKAEREELNALETKLDRLPTAVLPEDRKAMDIIRRAAAILGTDDEK